MPLQIDSFLFILRLLLVVLLYLFLMQVVISITRDLRKSAATAATGAGRAQPVYGHLVVVDSGPSNILPGTRFDLAPQTNIGRGPTNTIQIPDSFISAENSKLWYHNGSWFVQDMGSVNGTYVNNQPAVEALPARVGDILRVGYIQFKLTQ
jgi:pSer/pThr/pTyr-binding forkhead associated (FHA) protein